MCATDPACFPRKQNLHGARFSFVPLYSISGPCHAMVDGLDGLASATYSIRRIFVSRVKDFGGTNGLSVKMDPNDVTGRAKKLEEELFRFALESAWRVQSIGRGRARGTT